MWPGCVSRSTSTVAPIYAEWARRTGMLKLLTRCYAVLLCPPPQMDSTPERQGVRQGNRDSRQDLQLSGSRLIALGVQCCCVVVCVVTLLRIACAARQQSPTVAPGGALADSAPAPPVRACLACLADRRACARPCASTRLELTSSLYPAHLWSAGQCMEICTCDKDTPVLLRGQRSEAMAASWHGV